MFQKQIKNLISNIEKPEKPLELDLILEGGAFNGSYELGVCYFLREMEKQNYIKINRISGASIGSVIGLCYILDKLDNYYDAYNEMRENWTKSLNVSLYKKFINTHIKDLSENIINKINNKLYITFNNIDTKEQLTKHEFKNKEDLIQTIFKSCHIPYVSDESICQEEFFIDGGMPFIFIDREREKINQNRDILYININYFSILFDSLNVKKEISLDGRILNGILNIYNLFLKKENNSMCSLMSKWRIQQYMMLRSKQMIIVLLVYFIYLFKKFTLFVHPVLQNFDTYNKFFYIIKSFTQDLFIKCII
jgi:hypothetical protein